MKNTINILKYLWVYGPSKPSQIATWLHINRVLVQKDLKILISQWYVSKTGKTPHVLYDITPLVYDHQIIQKSSAISTINNLSDISLDDKKILNTFYKIDSDWTILAQRDGFVKWAQKRWLDIYKSSSKYINICESIDKLKNECDLIDATISFENSLNKKYIDKIYIDEMYYADRYTYDEFGRWPLAEKAFFAKQSQSLDMIDDVISQIYDQIECLIYKNKIDAIAVVPWSIDRKNQLLKILQIRLQTFGLPFLDIYKYFSNKIPIAQKTLKWEHRFVNAINTIQINITDKYDNILLIDDFIWSGATMNISAMKLKKTNSADYIIGFSIVWNIDMSYEVINEI